MLYYPLKVKDFITNVEQKFFAKNTIFIFHYDKCIHCLKYSLIQQSLALHNSVYSTISVATGSGHLDHPGQPGHVLPRSTRSDPPYTHLIKYLGLTWILHRITFVNNEVSRWDVSDDVSTSCQYILKRIVVDGVEAPRKVTR